MGISELLLIALVVLIVFGPDKLPQLAKNIGKFAIVSIVFYLVGYNLGYGVPEGGFIGTPSIWVDSSSLETVGELGYPARGDEFIDELFRCRFF